MLEILILKRTKLFHNCVNLLYYIHVIQLINLFSEDFESILDWI